MQVEHLMSRVVYSCAASDSLSRAAELMWDHDCGCVPVVDSEHTLVGIITDRDIAMAAYTKGKRLSEVSVGEVMTRDVHVCLEADDVAVAQGRMRQYQLRRLPVTDSTRYLVGLVSLNDLAKQAARERGAKKPRVRLDEIGETLAAVGRPRGSATLVAAQ